MDQTPFNQVGVVVVVLALVVSGATVGIAPGLASGDDTSVPRSTVATTTVNGTIGTNASSTRLAKGESIWVAVTYDATTTNASTEVYGVQFSLDYNTSVLNVTAVKRGPYLRSDGNGSLLLQNTTDESAGLVDYGEVRRNTNDGVTGTGTVALVRIEATEAVGAPLGTVVDLNFTGVKVSDPDSSQIPTATQNGSVDTVDPYPPTAAFVANTTTVEVGETISLNASASTDNHRIVSYDWRLGDGTTRSGVAITHQYDAPGTYPVVLTVNDTENTETVRDTVQAVDTTPPTTDLSVNETVVEADREHVELDASNTTDAHRVAYYLWDVDGDGTIEANTTSPVITYVYPDTGTVTPEVSAVDPSGNVGNATASAISVEDTIAPNVSASASHTSRISQRNPVDLTYVATDERLNQTTLEVRRNGSVVYTESIANATGSKTTGTVTWNATNDTGDPVPNGNYELRVMSNDTAGNADTVTISVSVDTKPPTVNVTGIDETAPATTAPGGRTIYTNDTLAVAGTANGTPGDAQGVSYVVESTFTTFRTVMRATQAGGTWTADADLSNRIVDDGKYRIVATAIDPAHNLNIRTANATVVIDREAPKLAATVNQVNSSTARVNVTVVNGDQIEPGTMNVTVQEPNGSALTVPVSKVSGEKRWTGTFGLPNSTAYNVSAVARDRAGNLGTGSASITVKQVATTERTVTVLFEKTGMFIRFNTTREVNNTFVVISASETPNAPLASGKIGTGFFDARLDSTLYDNLDNATVGIPVTPLIPTAPSEVNISRYNVSADEWQPLDTRVKSVTLQNTTNTYWVTSTDQFSKYGATVTDTQSPELDSISPSAGEHYPGATDSVVSVFNYSDNISGVDPSNVTVRFDGGDVTNETGTTITSSYVAYNATGVAYSGKHTVTVTAVDNAGNKANFSTSYVVQDDSQAPTVKSASPTNGTEFSADTDNVTVSFSYSDDLSGVDTAASYVELDGQQLPATLGGSSVAYTITDLSAGETYNVTLVLVDDAGNRRTHPVQFAIADTEDDTAGGGGGGGGGQGGSDKPGSVDSVATETGATINFRDISGRQPVSVEVPNMASERASVTGMEITTKFDEGSFRVEFTKPQSKPPGSAPALESAKGQAVDYFTAEAIGVSDDRIASVTVTFRLSESEIPDDRSKDDVQLFRYVDGEWVALETTHLGGNEFRATSPGFTTFAIGIQTSDVATATATATPTMTATETATPTETEEVTTTTSARTTTTETETSKTLIPGFEAPLAVLAILLTTLLLRRKREGA